MKSGVIKLKNQPVIVSAASVVGRRENEGPLSSYFDYFDKTDSFGEKTFEKSESEMQHIVLNLALGKVKLSESMIEAVFAGDLINQCTSSSYGLLSFGLPYFGLYGACSTAAEALTLSSLLVNAGYYSFAAAVSSSHNCSAERQFRFPLEYGGQRPPTAQWTVTGSGAFIVADENAVNEYNLVKSQEKDSGSGEKLKPLAYITELLPGRMVDRGITDANNMGSAMAPVDVNIGLLFLLKNLQIGFSQYIHQVVFAICLLTSIYSSAVS